MSPQLFVLFVVAVGLPLGWLASEFQPRRWLRILLGILALSMSVFLAFGFSLLERLNYNAWYGAASAQLIDTTIVEVEQGRTERLLPALRSLRSEFAPTYMNRAHYDQLVNQFAEQIKPRRPSEK